MQRFYISLFISVNLPQIYLKFAYSDIQIHLGTILIHLGKILIHLMKVLILIRLSSNNHFSKYCFSYLLIQTYLEKNPKFT